MDSKPSHSSRKASPPSTPVQGHPHRLEAEGPADSVSVGVLLVLHRHTQQSWVHWEGFRQSFWFGKPSQGLHRRGEEPRPAC